jgi:dipeptidase E
MLMSNSFSPGRGALEHAMDELAELFAGASRVLFVPFAGDDPDAYTEAMSRILAGLDIEVIGAHRVEDPLVALTQSDAVFVGGGNAFRLLRAVQRNGLLSAIRAKADAGMPYLGVSAGTNLACPTIRTTNDMPIVEPASLAALGLVPFQINPHYPHDTPDDARQRELRDRRLLEFIAENDVPVLGLCEGSWLRVQDAHAALGGTTGARLFTRGTSPQDYAPGDDLTALLGVTGAYDRPVTHR